MAKTSINSSGVKFPDDTVQTTASNVTGIPVITQHSTPGAFTKTSDLKAIKVTVIGSGGGGASAPTGWGSGGGGGGFAQKIYPAASLPASAVPFTVGAAVGTEVAGNSSSFGTAPLTVITATGGGAGVSPASSSYSTALPANGGAGGAGSNGDINGTGAKGGSGGKSSTPAPLSTTYVTVQGQGGMGVLGIGNGGGYGGGGSVGAVIIEELY